MRRAARTRDLLRKAEKARGRAGRLQDDPALAGGVRTARKRTRRFRLSNVRFFVQIARRRAATALLQKMRKRVLQADSTRSKWYVTDTVTVTVISSDFNKAESDKIRNKMEDSAILARICEEEK